MSESAAFSVEVISTTDVSTEAVLVRLSGEIDLDALDAMDTATETVIGLAPASVNVVVAAVTFIDSSGLNALLALRKRCAGIGTAVTLLHPSPQVTALLDMTGLAHYFGMPDDSV